MRGKAKAILREAKVVASDETGVRIEGTNSYHWAFHCKNAVVHQPDYSRAARVVEKMMSGHVPQVWLSDRYSAQQKHGAAHLAHRGATRPLRWSMDRTICLSRQRYRQFQSLDNRQQKSARLKSNLRLFLLPRQDAISLASCRPKSGERKISF